MPRMPPELGCFGSQFSLNHSIVSSQPSWYPMIGWNPKSFSAALMSNHLCIVSTVTLNCEGEKMGYLRNHTINTKNKSFFFFHSR
jgi:hypothetical protein